MGQRTRVAVLAMATLVMFSVLALAQGYRDYDDDDGYRQGGEAQARQRGYDRGYRDGLGKGEHEGRENDPFDYRTPDWRQGTRGYKDWMGPINWYQRGYQEGYRDGFQAGFRSARPGYGDRGSYFFDRGSDSPAYRIGYEDGANVAREDIERGKRFNPNPRGRYDDEDHGYRREYGDKHAYKVRYADGYREGYQANYRGYRY
jgi:hypothetical protein